MKKHSTISITIAALASASLLVGCGASGGDEGAAATSTSVLADGTVEVYEVNEDGEVVGTVPADDGAVGADAASGAEGGAASDGSSSGSSGATEGGSGDGASNATDPGSSSGGTDAPEPAPGAGETPVREATPAPTPEPAPEPEPAPAPAPEPVVEAPTVAVTRQTCNGPNLIVSMTANAGNGYRKGIRSVTVARQNEYGVFLTKDAQWLGPETGAGNVWNGTLGGNRQNIGKVLKVTVTSDAGQTITKEQAITAPC